MTDVTSKGIIYPTSGDQIAPLETVFANMADSVNTNFAAIASPTFTGTVTAPTLSSTKIIGDVYASNGTSKILENGTSGSDASFTGHVTGDVTGTASKAIDIVGGGAMSLPYQNATDDTVFLAAGTAGNVLKTNGTGSAPVWAIPNYSIYADATARNTAIPTPTEGMSVYLADVNQITTYLGSAWYPVAGQVPLFNGKQTGSVSTPTSGTKYTLTFSSTTLRGGMTEASGEVTVPVTGWYQVSAQVNWASGAAATRDIIISWYDGAAWNEINMTRSHMTGTGTMYQNVSGQVYLTAGQKVRTQGSQYTGSVNMSGTVIPCGMVINYIGA